jgi:hypothetical protein
MYRYNTFYQKISGRATSKKNQFNVIDHELLFNLKP